MKSLSQDVKDYWIHSTVPYLDCPSTVDFLRAQMNYHPYIIRGHMNDWKALSQWDIEYITRKIGDDVDIPVNITPDGLADSIKLTEDQGQVFTYPYEQNMTCKDFTSMLTNPEINDSVPYLSQQNDNFRQMSCYHNLIDDVPNSIDFMNELKIELEAINLWIGDERSISSLHKDHFENLYCVMSGQKTFTLLPPTDCAFLPEIKVKTMKYQLNDNVTSRRISKHDLELVNYSNEYISWCPIDPNDDLTEVLQIYPELLHINPIKCCVNAGEILYIPAMWYHRVSQNGLTIALNYWYEQNFNYR